MARCLHHWSGGGPSQQVHPSRDLGGETGALPALWSRVTIAGIVAVAVVAWLVFILLDYSQIRFVLAPEARVGFEVFLALLQMFAALVLFLFPTEAARSRLRWVALGFMILGIGGLCFGFLYPTASGMANLNAALYGKLVTQTLAMFAIVVGLLYLHPPAFSLRTTLLMIAAFVLLAVIVIVASSRLPTLVQLENLETIASTSSHTLSGLTEWYWGLSVLPLTLAMAAAVGAAWRSPGRVLGGWLLVAMVLMAGAQLHTLFWPSGYSSILTTSSLLRLAFTVVAALGGFLELRRMATDHAASLALEREYVARMEDLAKLRADFTAIVAHELGNPLAAIQQAAELLATGALDPVQERVLAVVKSEATELSALVADVRAAAAADREDFVIEPRPIPVQTLLADAAAFANVLPGNHSITVENTADVAVLADLRRVGQVMRNLLSNAAKYSSPGTPIRLRAIHSGARVRIEVIDHGSGIQPDDLTRIFEKFGRGRDGTGRKVPGVGLGLYMSRHIVQAHGSELTVHSTVGVGSTFSFDLEVAPWTTASSASYSSTTISRSENCSRYG